MNTNPRFNYIITIHNKEELIEKVITSILMLCKHDSHIYAVLDGCTDHTEYIIDTLISTYNDAPINKIILNDVHELLSINAGLKSANQDGNGFNIILQDDVILEDINFEDKIIRLYTWGGKSLGVVSFRLGANISPDILTSNDPIPQTNFVENAYGHGISEAKLLLPNRFAYRQIAIKSPICVPSYLVRKIGYLNKKLAPYAHDDLEYGIRCYLAGYKNGVFAIKFRSDIKWGGTRNNAHPEMQKIINRNISNIKKWYKKELALMVKEPVKDKIYSHIVKTSKIQDKIAKEQWHNNKLQLTKYYSQNISLITKLFHFFSQKIHIIRYLSQKIISNLNEQYRRYLYLNHSGKPLTDYTFTESQQVFNSNIKKYYYYTQYTQQLLPKILLKHRKYFSQNNRGFGEDAFHAMWWLLFREYKLVNCLEIGVYRGQAISAWAIIAKLLNYRARIVGISPLSSLGDSVSTYEDNLDYQADIVQSFKYFHLAKPRLVKALSTDQKAIKFIRSRVWDLIYIDGSHDFNIVLQDYKLAQKSLKHGGILIFDDSSLYLDYNPPQFAFKGHPGPSRVAKNHAMKTMRHLGTVGHCNVFQKI